MALFPLFVKLDGRHCLAVGAGPIGESKIAGLLEAGAVVRVVSPAATDQVQEWARQGRLTWVPRRFTPSDLDGAFLVVGALPAGDDLTSVYEEARRRGVLCNAVDDPPHCDFYYPAVVKRGSFQIAVSTGGHSPALAQRIRQELEVQFGPEYESWLADLGRVREELFATAMDPEERKRLLHVLAGREAFERYRAGFRLWATGSGSRERESIPGQKPEARSPKPGKVFLIGAGPGDPELLTLKALRVLGTADVVLHDDLVPAEVLELVPPGAVVKNVGKRHGEQHISQDQIGALLVEYAEAGLMVARLKGGDVSIFGRANEEIDALRAAAIEFDIVPGVTAVSGAAAAALVSLTDRRASSAVVLVTAQTCKGNARPDWRAIASTGATMAIYMPGEHYGRVASELLSAGLDADMPCLLVSRASQPGEVTVEATVGKLASLARLPAPAILIVGEVVRKAPAAAATSESFIEVRGAPPPRTASRAFALDAAQGCRRDTAASESLQPGATRQAERPVRGGGVPAHHNDVGPLEHQVKKAETKAMP
jgi:uroporphyrin-III C-methyltransferase/precorrin-2 dehydrogenase/sirohydrochlorin ferrochelatase